MNSASVEFYFYSTISLSCLYLIAITYYKYFISRNWEQLYSEILKLNVSREAQGQYLSGGKDKEVKSIDVQYTYSSSDSKYIGTRVSFIDDLPIFSNYQTDIYTVLNKHITEKEKLPIYINPKNKRSSIIIRKLNLSKIAILAIICVSFFLLSLNKLDAATSYSFFSYILCLILLIPTIAVERISFKNNLSSVINAN